MSQAQSIEDAFTELRDAAPLLLTFAAAMTLQWLRELRRRK